MVLLVAVAVLTYALLGAIFLAAVGAGLANRPSLARIIFEIAALAAVLSAASMI